MGVAPREFPLSPTPALSWLGGGIVAFDAIVVTALFATGAPHRALGVALPVMLGTVLLLGWLVVLGPRYARVVVGDGLVVLPRPYRRREVRREEILSMRIVEWPREPDLAPALRLWGTSIGRYHVGTYSLRNGRRALLMTGAPRMLCVETADRLLLLAPDHFEHFVEAVERTLGPVRRSPRQE